MKKKIFLVFAIAILMSSLIGCNQNAAYTDHANRTGDMQDDAQGAALDVWNGTVASSFKKGDGSETAPFEIETAEQLAFLASEINSGKSYTGKSFILTADIDLDGIPWTPIGNGTYRFDAFFDGNHHTIKNLKIMTGMYFVGKNAAGEHPQYTTGLFGSCMNSVIKNLTIDQAEIKITNTVDRYSIAAGVLAGDIQVNTSTEISNVRISNARIIADFLQEDLAMNLMIGGISGYMHGDSEASCTISQIQSDVQVSIENGRARNNHIGGIIGFLGMKNLCNIQECASYLSVALDIENCYSTHNYLGALGYLSAQKNKVSLTDIFSKVAVNKIHDYFHGYTAYTANVISGETSCGVQENGGFQFQNLFGFVEQVDQLTGQKATAMQLYEIPYPEIYTETNCKGCTSLPEGHGFDPDIWDLSSLDAPALK